MKYIKNKPKRDESEVKSWRFNIVDIAIILVLVFLVLVSIEYFTDFSFFGSDGKDQMIEYTIEFENANKVMAASVSAGDEAHGSGGAGDMGEVSLVNIAPQLAYVYDPETATMVARELPGSGENDGVPVTFRVTVRVKAVYKAGNGYTAGGQRISVGSPVDLSFEGFSGSGKCIAIYGLD